MDMGRAVLVVFFGLSFFYGLGVVGDDIIPQVFGIPHRYGWGGVLITLLIALLITPKAIKPGDSWYYQERHFGKPPRRHDP